MGRAESRVTLKMIAEKAGSSIGTVDRALNNRGGIKENSKKHILKVAEELGYRPNKLASALGRKKAIKLAVAYPEHPHDFYKDIDSGIDRAAEELRDYSVIIEKLRYETQDQALLCKRLGALAAADFDGLAVNSAGGMVAGEINRFMAAGVPVITFNSDAADSERLFYIGNDSRQSGMMGAELLAMMLGGRGKVTALGNFVGLTPFLERFGGFCEHIQMNCPEISIFPCAESYSDTELAAKSLGALIEQVPDLGGIFCAGYASTVGAITALRALGRRDIRLVGYDLTDFTADALGDQICDAILYQAPREQGYRAASLLARHVLDGWLPATKRLHVDTQIILKSNLGSYLGRSEAGF